MKVVLLKRRSKMPPPFHGINIKLMKCGGITPAKE
jgi:L-alanine-DL-glutamate epimerase-like enolase superfamily enzyme